VNPWEISETECSKAQANSLSVFLPYVSKNLPKIHFEYMCTDTEECHFHETITEVSLLKVIEEVSKCEDLTMANHILHQAPVPLSSDHQGRVQVPGGHYTPHFHVGPIRIQNVIKTTL
jgi:hypothetical protein